MNRVKKKYVKLEKDICRKIKELRKEKRVTLQQLGDVLDVSKTCIYHMEKGENMLNAGKLGLIAKYFNVDANFFYDDFQSETSQIEHIFEDLDKTQQEAIVNMAYAFKRVNNKKRIDSKKGIGIKEEKRAKKY